MKVPIPAAGPFRVLFEYAQTSYPSYGYSSALNRLGSFADELFLWSPGREEFEFVLADFSQADSTRARGRILFF